MFCILLKKRIYVFKQAAYTILSGGKENFLLIWWIANIITIAATLFYRLI